jgi:ketosteroid isomerase-like protein
MPEMTSRIVDAYYDCWANGDFDRFGEILTDDFVFRGAMDRADGPAAFVELIRRNAPLFGGARFTDVRRVVDGPRAVSLYTFEVGAARVPMAEAFEVRGEQISRIDLYFDPAQFAPVGAPPQ